MGAIFEVDVLATFIPSAFMYVKLAVQVWANAFDSSPMYLWFSSNILYGQPNDSNSNLLLALLTSSKFLFVYKFYSWLLSKKFVLFVSFRGNQLFAVIKLTSQCFIIQSPSTTNIEHYIAKTVALFGAFR